MAFGTHLVNGTGTNQPAGVLAGATLGQAAPTPGGLGAVELALSAGLTAAGVEGSIAVSSVLLFRLLTFWLPTIPGWFSFNWLSKKGYL